MDWYTAELERLKVDLRLSTSADAALVEQHAPDAVVIASGGVGSAPPVPGIDLPRVADLRTWLASPSAVPDDQTVTIWGADRVGVAAADLIAGGGARLLLIGAQAELAPEAGRREKILVVPRLQSNPRVRIELECTLEVIEPERLLVGRAGAREWMGASGPLLVSKGTVPATVDVGSGAWQTFVVGEAGFGVSADDAIRQGAAAGMRIG